MNTIVSNESLVQDRPMANHWPDRRPPRPPKPVHRRAEFWVGGFTVAVCVALLSAFLAWLLA